jgi:hypothetical protein
MTGQKGMHQRVWQADNLDEGHHAGAFNLPEWRLGKAFTSKDLPTRDRPAVSIEACGELTDAAW